MIRTFIAVDLPQETRSRIAEFQAQLAGDGLRVRWVNPDTIHITLKFLGEIPESLVKKIRTGIFEQPPMAEPFTIEIGGTGVFPNSRKPRILWVGITRGGGELIRLAESIDNRLALMNAPREKRPFRPHITIGRFRQPAAAHNVQDFLSPEIFSAAGFRVESVLLMKSVLTPSGAEHTVLCRHVLTGDSPDDGRHPPAPETDV